MHIYVTEQIRTIRHGAYMRHKQKGMETQNRLQLCLRMINRYNLLETFIFQMRQHMLTFIYQNNISDKFLFHHGGLPGTLNYKRLVC